MDSKNVQQDEKHVEGAGNGLHDGVSNSIGSGELVTLDNGVSRDVTITELPPKEERRILRKVDFRVVPLLTFLYLIAYIDRNNIGNAKVAGLATDLNLVGLKYNAAVTLFFVPYCLLEVPSNIILKLMRPSRWISLLLFSWGLVMTLMGFVNSYSGLLTARWFLGVAESGFFPAASFLLTIWYKRYEYQRRLAILYAMASLAGAFSGLLAFAIEKMDGIGGRTGWQWIFILEGLVPIVCSSFMWKLLPDDPETCNFLEKHEKEFIINRIAIDTGTGRGRVTNTDRIHPRYIKAGLSDWKVWCMVIVSWGNSVGIYGFSATIPTVIEELGYSAANAQLRTIPLYVFAAILTVTLAFFADRAKRRWYFVVLSFSIAVAGFIAQLAIPHPKFPGLTYAFLFPIAGGMYSGYPPMISWIANNISPSSKRAVGMALFISCGNMGSIMGSNIYLAKQAPKYPVGFGVSMTMLCLAICMATFLRFAYAAENKKREALLAELGEEGVRAKYTEDQLVNMGDKSPFFRYSL